MSIKLGCSYFGNYHLRHVKTDFEELKRDGFNTLTIPLSENDFQFWKQTVFDIISLAKDFGFEVYTDPWGVGKVFGGEAYSWFVAKYPSECQILEDGTRVPHACPLSTGFRDYLYQWLDGVGHSETDYVLWDEPHFYIPGWAAPSKGTWACHCPRCQQNYLNQYGVTLPLHTSPQISHWKSSILIEFLSDLCQINSTLNKKNALILLPNHPSKAGSIPWEDIHHIKKVDVFGTDPYWIWDKQPLESYVSDFSQKTLYIANRNLWEPQIWLQGMMIPSGQEWEMERALELTIQYGIRNISFWGYNCCHHISYTRCGDPDLAWDTLRQAVRKAAEKYV